MPESPKLQPSEIVSTLIDGAPSMAWELEKRMPDGTLKRFPYRMQVLRIEENVACVANAQAYAKKKGELEGYGDIYREAQVHELLQRAMRQPEKFERPDGTSFYPPVFTDADQLRASLTETECAALLNAYQITKDQFGSIKGLESEDAETWIARLSDPLQGPFFLSQLDSRHWAGAILMLAKVAASLFEELGRPLPNSRDSSASDPESSTGSTGLSGEPATASSTDGEFTVPGDRLLSKDEALAMAKARKSGVKPTE